MPDAQLTFPVNALNSPKSITVTSLKMKKQADGDEWMCKVTQPEVAGCMRACALCSISGCLLAFSVLCRSDGYTYLYGALWLW